MNGGPDVRVVGMGSSHGDDAVGWAIISELEKLPAISGCEVCRVHGGNKLIDLLEGLTSLILIDAIESSSKVGELHQFTWPDSRIDCLAAASTHHFGVAQAFQLAQALGVLPKTIIVLAIAIGRFSPGVILSPAVISTVPGIARQVHLMASELAKRPASP